MKTAHKALTGKRVKIGEKNKEFFSHEKIRNFLGYTMVFPFFDAILISYHTCKFLLIFKSSCSNCVNSSSRRFHLIKRPGCRIPGLSNPGDPVQPFQPRFSG